jgi:dUTP pyrophosphatase
MIKKGEAIGQGIIKTYLTTDDDNASGVREGGFGSTTR